MAIDPAGRGGAGSDELAWAVVAEYAGNLFVLESGGTTQGYSEEVLKTLAQGKTLEHLPGSGREQLRCGDVRGIAGASAE